MSESILNSLSLIDDKLLRTFRSYESSIALATAYDKINKVLAPPALDYSAITMPLLALESLKLNDAFKNHVLPLNVLEQIGLNTFNYPWIDILPNIYFSKPIIDNSDYLNNVLITINSLQLNVDRVINNINPDLPKSTIKDGLIATINLDLERDNNSSQEVLNELFTDASNFVQETNQNAVNLYDTFNNYLISLFLKKKFPLTQELLKHIAFELMTALILNTLIPQQATVNGNQANNNSSTTNNTETTNITNNVTNVDNTTNIYVGNKVNTINPSGLTPVKDKRYKTLIDIPVGAQLTVIQSSRIWMLVTYVDDSGFVHIGYISKENFKQ